jgi:hypothetical protein
MNLKENMKRFGTKNLSEQMIGNRLNRVDPKDIEKYKQNEVVKLINMKVMDYVPTAAKLIEKDLKAAGMKLENGLSITPDEIKKYMDMAIANYKEMFRSVR